VTQKPPVPPGGFCFSSTKDVRDSIRPGRKALAVDYQIVFPQEAIKISAVKRVPGASPPALDVLGEDFTSVDEVLINEIPVRQFIILGQNRMIVTLPAQVQNVQTVAVTSRRFTITERSFLKFKISRSPSKVAGILRLVQLFIKILFTTSGSDIFNKRLGAGALQNLGKTFGKSQSGSIISDFVVAVENTSRQIIAMQGRQPGLPQDERLLSARVTSAYFSHADAALIVAVELTSQAGRAAVAQVVV